MGKFISQQVFTFIINSSDFFCIPSIGSEGKDPLDDLNQVEQSNVCVLEA